MALTKLLAKPYHSAAVYSGAPPIRLSTVVMTGVMKFSVREVTMPVNAPPMRTPMAMSIMLPRRANALNSSINFFMFLNTPRSQL